MIEKNYTGREKEPLPSGISSLYKEIILDHYKDPRNFGQLQNPDAEFHGYNPTCGDEIKMQLHIEDGKIKEIKFSGRGCAISMAASSMLTEKMKGRPLKDAKNLTPEKMIEMLGIEISPGRIKCATLGMVTLKKAADLVERDENE